MLQACIFSAAARASFVAARQAGVEELHGQGLAGLWRACCAIQGASWTPVPAQPPQEHWQRMSIMEGTPARPEKPTS